MKVFPFVVFSTWLKKAIVLTVCLYKIKDCETSVKENLTIIQPGMLQRRGNKSPPAGGCCFTGLSSETPYMGMLYDDVLVQDTTVRRTSAYRVWHRGITTSSVSYFFQAFVGWETCQLRMWTYRSTTKEEFALYVPFNVNDEVDQ